MTSVGATLRSERLKRNLDIQGISRELKISGRMLEAIEADQFERLPGGVFAKAFVRQYGNLLGLDGEELAGQVQRTMEPPALQMDARARPSVNPIEVPRVEEWTSLGDKGFRFSGSLSAAALVVAVVLICSAIYAWMQRPRPAPVTQAAQTAPVVTQPAAQPVPPPVAAAQPVPADTPAVPPAQPPAAASAEPAAPAPATPTQTAESPAPAAAPGPVHVELVADEIVWVLARVDGKYAFSDTMEPNSRRTLDANKEVLLRLGNAGGITILLNGKSIGPAGPKGQVRTVQLTSGGFQIVSPKPPDAPGAAPDR